MEPVPETTEKVPESNVSSNSKGRHRRANTMVPKHHSQDEQEELEEAAFGADDRFTLLQNQGRSLSLMQHSSQRDATEAHRFYPKSHLMEGFMADGQLQYFSLWLLPPKPIRKSLATEIAKLSLRYSPQGSSAAFMPHVTVIGSIPCANLRQARELGERLKKNLQHSGAVPCRFSQQAGCQAMYTNTTDKDDQHQLVWSQSCIAMMEKSPEFMHLLHLARDTLALPAGEWMFPGPAGQPHFSKFYGAHEIPRRVSVPDDFLASEAALWATTPGTIAGVANWREVTRIPLS